jgi:hypothetical protein
MDTQQIVAELLYQRDRLNAAIDVLQGPTKRGGRPPGSGKKQSQAVAEPTTTAAKKVKTKWTPAQREAARRRAKAMWAKRKKAAKKAA